MQLRQMLAQAQMTLGLDYNIKESAGKVHIGDNPPGTEVYHLRKVGEQAVLTRVVYTVDGAKSTTDDHAVSRDQLAGDIDELNLRIEALKMEREGLRKLKQAVRDL